MSTSAARLNVVELPTPSDDAVTLARLEGWLPPLLSVIAGMVDLTGFFMLGNIFTAHITGNLVVVAAAILRGGPLNTAQAWAIPVAVAALAASWVVARVSGRRGPALAELLLFVHFFLLCALLVFSVLTKPSANPHGLMAGIAAMIAVCAMAVQYALFRLAIPASISTAVMTGNLTTAVLALMDTLFPRHPLMANDATRLKRALQLLCGFLTGCAIAAAVLSSLKDWSWSVPVVLAGAACWFASTDPSHSTPQRIIR
jgi:uncharacterized membrane protein YoaK (UPF0700 family)